MVRPHVVFPDQLPADFRRAMEESFPGSGQAYLPIDPETWETVTDGMADVTQPALFHTAGSAHLEGIDFGGKTGTAQLMSHEALGKTNKGRSTYPNVWFIGVTPRRNPELVVAVLWQNGDKSYYPARIGAQIVSAYVEKQRRLANNLVVKPAAPVEVGAMWSEPGWTPNSGGKAGAPGEQSAKIQTGHFFVNPGQGGAKGGEKQQVSAASRDGKSASQPQNPVSTKTLQAASGPKTGNLQKPAAPLLGTAAVAKANSSPAKQPQAPKGNQP
jgi:penicillin-binding protein 2